MSESWPDKVALSDHRVLMCPMDARPSKIFKDRKFIDMALSGELTPRREDILTGPGVDGSGGDFVVGVIEKREREKKTEANEKEKENEKGKERGKQLEPRKWEGRPWIHGKKKEREKEKGNEKEKEKGKEEEQEKEKEKEEEKEKEKEKEKEEDEEEPLIYVQQGEDGKTQKVLANPAIALDGDEELLSTPMSTFVFPTPRLVVEEGSESDTSYSREIARQFSFTFLGTPPGTTNEDEGDGHLSNEVGDEVVEGLRALKNIIIVHPERVPLFNLRDLADATGLNSNSPGGSFEQFTPRTIYRSACISRGGITKEEASHVIRFIKNELQVKTIIDLRDKKEKAMDPHDSLLESFYPTLTGQKSLPRPGARRRYSIPLMNVTLKVVGLFWDGSHARTKIHLLKSALGQSSKTPTQTFAEEAMNPIGLFGLNKLMLIYGAREIAEVLRVCMNKSLRPILYHCSSGKDRTGLITALILSICDVDEERIIEDYHKSEFLLQPVMHLIEKENAVNGLVGFDDTPAEVMRATLQYIKNEWGSVRGYLSNYAGFSDSEMEELKASFVYLTLSDKNLIYTALGSSGMAGASFSHNSKGENNIK